MSADSNLDMLLDGTLDDVADMPEFVIPNSGTYLTGVKSFGPKKVNDKTGIEIVLIFKELLEAADESADPQTLPIEASTMFFLTNDDGSANELGQGQWKMFLAVCAEITGESTPRSIMAASAGVDLIVTSSHRVHKDDKKKPVEDQRRYLKINNVLQPE